MPPAQERSAKPLGYLRKLLTIYGVVLTVEVVLILRVGHGVFSYSLDDPYIHLALAQRILHGHYGLNAGEPSSPSSSILWPFLLAPISTVWFRAWSPLLLNVLSAAGASFLLDKLLERWRVLDFEPATWARAAQWSLSLFLVFAGNFIGLSIVGMEHLLQVCLMTGCCYGLLEAYADRPIPTWVLVMAVLGPVVRYEDLAFTVAVALACAVQARWKAGIATFVAAIIPLGLFSLFLHSRGLPVLPISVLIKAAGASGTGTGMSVGQGSVLKSAWLGSRASLSAYVHERDRWNITLGVLAIAGAALWNYRKPPARNALLCALVAAVLLMALGPYGWMMRYEVALRLFVLLILLITVAIRLPYPVGAVLLLALLFGNSYRAALKQSVRGSQTIVREQYWIHVFEERYYHGPIAVNDLGWVSFDHDPKVYVLDLGGLGSVEAAFVKRKDAPFLDAVTREHGVGLVAVYRAWFPDVPAGWVLLGRLWQPPTPQGYLGYTFVSLFATRPQDAPRISGELRAFQQTLPADVYLDLAPVEGPR